MRFVVLDDPALKRELFRLTRESKDIVTHWIEEKVKVLIDCPRTWDLVGVMPVGVPAERPERRRQPLTALVYQDVFGRPPAGLGATMNPPRPVTPLIGNRATRVSHPFAWAGEQRAPIPRSNRSRHDGVMDARAVNTLGAGGGCVREDARACLMPSPPLSRVGGEESP